MADMHTESVDRIDRLEQTMISQSSTISRIEAVQKSQTASIDNLLTSIRSIADQQTANTKTNWGWVMAAATLFFFIGSLVVSGLSEEIGRVSSIQNESRPFVTMDRLAVIDRDLYKMDKEQVSRENSLTAGFRRDFETLDEMLTKEIELRNDMLGNALEASREQFMQMYNSQNDKMSVAFENKRAAIILLNGRLNALEKETHSATSNRVRKSEFEMLVERVSSLERTGG